MQPDEPLRLVVPGVGVGPGRQQLQEGVVLNAERFLCFFSSVLFESRVFFFSPRLLLFLLRDGYSVAFPPGFYSKWLCFLVDDQSVAHAQAYFVSAQPLSLSLSLSLSREPRGLVIANPTSPVLFIEDGRYNTIGTSASKARRNTITAGVYTSDSRSSRHGCVY